MTANQHSGAPLDELRQAIDELALQVMVKGAAALSQKVLKRLAEMASAPQTAELAQAAQDAQDRLRSTAATDEDANAIVATLQTLLAKASEPAPQPQAPADLINFEDDAELLGDFVLESDEHLAAIQEKALLLEKDPTLLEAIHAVFRCFHSMKGLAGFLGLSGVQTVAHEVETLLDHARNQRILVSSDVVDLILDSSEYLKDEVALVRARLAGNSLPPVRDNTELIRILSAANADIAASRPLTLQRESPAAGEVLAEPVGPAPQILTVSVVASTKSNSQPPALVAVASQPITPEAIPAGAPETATVPSEEPAPERPVVALAERQGRSETASTSVRVETSKLDRLMDMVGEMVIAQSILNNTARFSSSAGERLTTEMAQLARITTEVQRCAMSMRMMPIRPLFQKNAKLVRDLSRRHGKQVELELAGESTELDKTIAEELADPLLHMIRNALDHGIETPAERIAMGKPAAAALRISAAHEAGQIMISISDDGRGLDPQKIRSKAVQKKLIDESAQLSEEDIYRLIFAPGFSTAEKITDISGRGVGMDVVRQHVEGLRGRIEIKSELGRGTTFSIYLPLTLAIIEGLVILVGEHRYIIPLFSVREMFRPTQDMLFTVQGTQEMILIRGSLLPLVRLYDLFSVTPRTREICEGLLVVCEFSDKRFCLFVDDLHGRQEVVIKSLDEAFKSVKGLAGSAILGDGRIGLILDVAGIFHRPYQGQELLGA